MRLALLALAAALAGCAPATSNALPQLPARWGPYSVDLVDEGGAVLPTFQHRGRTYVLGVPGQRYLLRIRNGSGQRVEVVASVDGRDVADGRPASTDKRGYLVEPWGEVVVDGYRLTEEAVAAFRFSSVPRSYAALKGDARDVGVIGVAVFPERAPRPLAAPWRPRPYPRPDASAAPEGAGAPPSAEASRGAEGEVPPGAEDAVPGGAGARADASPPSAQAEAKAADRAARPGLGTEFGEAHDSPVTHVPFERARARPDAMLTLRYDDRAGLLAAGVDLDGRRWARDERWLRESADPFRRDAGYAEPPAGWRGR